VEQKVFAGPAECSEGSEGTFYGRGPGPATKAADASRTFYVAEWFSQRSWSRDGHCVVAGSNLVCDPTPRRCRAGHKNKWSSRCNTPFCVAAQLHADSLLPLVPSHSASIAECTIVAYLPATRLPHTHPNTTSMSKTTLRSQTQLSPTKHVSLLCTGGELHLGQSFSTWAPSAVA